MGERPVYKPAALRRAVTEWAAQGFSVRIEPDGSVLITPPTAQPSQDPFDLVDMKR